VSEGKKLKPMSDRSFKFMIWAFKLVDLFFRQRRHLEKVPLREGMVVVDYGCGPGRYTIPIAELVGPKGKVFAVDIHPLAIKTVKEKAARSDLKNVEAVLVDSFNTGIQSSSADLVLAIDMIHSITDYDALFHEIHRILKPNGLLFMDAEHIKISKAQEIVASSGLFTMKEQRGRDMLLTKRLKTEAKVK
jgi:ubiquinone/menaquinone biosynthesis C-methylase UbiE